MLDSFPLLTSFQNDSLASSKGEKHFCHCGLMNLTIFVFSLLQFLSFLMLELSHPLAIGSSSSLLPNLLDMTLVIFDRNLPSELKYDLNRQNGPWETRQGVISEVLLLSLFWFKCVPSPAKASPTRLLAPSWLECSRTLPPLAVLL